MDFLQVYIFKKTTTMAEINQQPSQKKSRRTVCSKKSTRVDLTPMVDLGFILITFFIFTSTLQQPKAMNLLSPNDSNIHLNDSVCESCALTFILGANNQLFYYHGIGPGTGVALSSYSPAGIRQLILEKKKVVIDKRGADQMVIIVKPTQFASFKNMVDVVDECNISLVKRYYIDEPTADELSSIVSR